MNARTDTRENIQPRGKILERDGLERPSSLEIFLGYLPKRLTF